MAKMTPKQIGTRLEKIVLLINALDADLKEQYGEDAFVFFEADGGTHAMDGDEDPDKGTAYGRQSHIIASARTYCRGGSGAW